MTETDQITVLLAEYSSLRDELIELNTNQNQTFGTGAVLIAGALALIPGEWWLAGIIFSGLVVIFLAFFSAMLRYNTDDAAARVRDIESAVNEIAGKQLLVWETTRGLNAVSYRDRVRVVLRGKSD
jgi:membrane protein implicated in regulation of membrane protease activity